MKKINKKEKKLQYWLPLLDRCHYFPCEFADVTGFSKNILKNLCHNEQDCQKICDKKNRKISKKLNEILDFVYKSLENLEKTTHIDRGILVKPIIKELKSTERV
jgi:hypothetical protein